MDTVLHCDCGFEVRGAGEARLVEVVRRHAWAAHGMALSHDEALLLAFRAELDEPSLVELTNVIALENYRARFNWAFGIEGQGFTEGSFCVPPEARVEATPATG